MDKNTLLDNVCYTGTDYTEFENHCKELAGITKLIKAHGRECEIYSYVDTNVHANDPDEPMTCWLVQLSEDAISKTFLRDEKLVAGHFNGERYGEELFKEFTNGTGLMMRIGGENYLVSPGAIKTLTIRSGVGGDVTTGRNNLIRNLHLADGIYYKNEPINFVYREVEDESGRPVKKIFAAFGGAYQLLPQTVLLDIIEKFEAEGKIGGLKPYKWAVDHRLTSISFDLPDIAEDMKSVYGIKDEIIPGIMLETSDTGDSSIVIKGTYRIGGSYITTDSVLAKHTKSLTAERVIEDADKKIFEKIRKLPECLMGLMSKEAADYSSLDLTSKDGQDANIESISDYMDIALSKCLSKFPMKRRTALREALIAELNPTAHYTLYDLAVMFIKVPERIEAELDAQSMRDLRAGCAQVPYTLAKATPKVGVVLKPE